MQNHLNDTLYNTAEDVFENLAFVLTMPEGEEFGDCDFDMGDFEPASFDDDTLTASGLDTGSDDFESAPLDDPLSVSTPTADTEASSSFAGLDDVEEFAGIDFDDEGSNSSSPGETLMASIHFRGAAEGELFLEVSEELLPVIGMNMLGLDDENALTYEEQKDAFCELLNVICGNLLPAVAGEKAVFNIDSAEIHPDTMIPEAFEGKTPLANAHFGLEVGHAKLALFADEKICQPQEATA